MRRVESGAGQAAAGSGAWVAFLLRHWLGGVVAGWTTVGGLLWLDVAGLGGLVMASDLFPLPLLMMLGSFGLTFGSVAVGSAMTGPGRSSDAAGAVPGGRRATDRSRRPDYQSSDGSPIRRTGR